MSFPTTSVLDNFTRANASTLGSNWTLNTNSSDWGDALGIISNTAYDVSYSNGGAAFWNTSYSGTLECYITFSTLPTSEFAGIAMSPVLNSTSETYYALTINSGHTSIALIKNTAPNSDTALTSFTQTVSTGDSIGFSRTSAGVMTVYYKASAGSWTSLGTYTDTSYSCSYLMMTFNDGTTRLSNFGGGTQSVNISFSASALSLTSSQNSPAPNNTILPSNQTITSSQNLPTPSVIVIPSNLSLTSTLYGPTVAILGNVTINIGANLSLTSTLNSPTPSITISPTQKGITSSQNAPTSAITTNTSALSITSSLNSVTPQVLALVSALTSTFSQNNVTPNVLIAPNSITITSSINSPSLNADCILTQSVLNLISQLNNPTISISSVGGSTTLILEFTL